MMRDGRVHAVHPPAIRAKDRWVPFVSWTPGMRERLLDLVDAAVGSYEGAVA
jgi:hypothetical protein